MITGSSAISCHICCNSNSLKQATGLNQLQEPLQKLFVTEEQSPVALDQKVPLHLAALNSLYRVSSSEFGRAALIAVGACEASHCLQVCASISNCNDRLLPPLMLFLQYLSQVEGPIWREVRGKGLAYAVSVMILPEEGLLLVDFYRSAQLVQAFQTTKKLIVRTAE